MKRDDFTLHLGFRDELIIDNFAGGGGTSTGLEAAFGRPVDIAINHDPEALAMHAINHPHTRHLLESVWDVDPIKVTGNQPVGLVWLSPDCKHFSKAKGGTPVAKHIRGLAWVGMRWIALCKPRVLMLENVEEFQTWGPVLVGADGLCRPDPARKGKTFESFVRQLRAHGYTVDWKELRACDQGAPTIRKRLFLIARRDGLPILWPETTHGDPTSPAAIARKLTPWRTAAECIDFSLPAVSIFDRKKALATNTQRRVAKGLWRHVLASAKPFIVGVGGRMGQSPERTVNAPLQTITSKADACVAQPVLAPFLNEHANASNQRTMAADEPLRTVCAQVKGGHFSVVATHITKFNTGSVGSAMDAPLSTVTAGGTPKRPSTGITQGVVGAALAPLRGTSEAHLGGHDVQAPLSTVSAGGTHHALLGASLVTVGYGERPGQQPRVPDIEAPMGTVVAGGVKHYLAAAHLTHLTHHGDRPGLTPDAPLPTITGAHRGEQALVAAHLVDMGHGEGKDGTKRFSHGVRSLEVPLNTVTASGATSALSAAYFEQANGGFYDGHGRPADAPMSTITAAGSNQQLVTAYCVKYYSSGGQWQGLAEPMHTVPTKGRMGLVQVAQVSADCLAPEHRARAAQCAALLHDHLPEHFPTPADLVLAWQNGQWWVLVDITLRMLKPVELFQAQGFPRGYVIHEIPDPALLFKDGVQAADPLAVPRIPLSITAQVRMCGNSVSPVQSEALVRANFGHEALMRGRAAA
ncbi:DNA cytosine methyltransferase [Xylophilus ampelinus]|uniref:DNA (cytosine-5-)-methyltransferase n=1 Tax=Xylophilus ampelinus TaxID=54067 RepID=A0A318SX90_9BURK|nr:DNA cytosine methyltransferase [Xylophilus ampelinus]MCS4508921.1 DNA cytosine methyltransferase [Xylophilus ampelinus]PYE79487.1 DNA (cytosine-5)-methyltransferase 1 [Xylophilus ampelinus]